MLKMPCVALGPLGRADQALLFGVPTAKDDSPFGTPSGLEQFADAVHCFEHAGRAARRIDGAEDPGVAVVAGDDPLIRIGGAVDGADDVPDGAIGVLLIE